MSTLATTAAASRNPTAHQIATENPCTTPVAMASWLVPSVVR
jgi:hypothetical protein